MIYTFHMLTIALLVTSVSSNGPKEKGRKKTDS